MIRRQAAFASRTSDDAIVIELTDDTRIAITQDAADLATTDQIQTSLRTSVDRVDIFVHRNRDGTLALAVGEEPDRWPEDLNFD
jgi:hypothetical protein